MAQVVEDEHHVGDHQRHVGQAERVGVGLAERLDRAHQVVAEEADGAAGERRQALDRRRLELRRGGAATARVGVGRGSLRLGRLAPAAAASPLHSESVPSLQRRIARGRRPTKE